MPRKIEVCECRATTKGAGRLRVDQARGIELTCKGTTTLGLDAAYNRGHIIRHPTRESKPPHSRPEMAS